ncbi:hypothetical protein ACIRJS_45020 [Streptomyces sp. NPDC102340]|uniref:hypothetical protein n=1 Tax=unclassified Streptomyces TaxID=2593676 RepID=UPI0037F406DB
MPPTVDETAALSLPTAPFNRRVEVLVAVIDAPDEAGLAVQLLEDRGWGIRPWEGSDPGSLGTGRRGLLVEVRLYGARFGAVQAAVAEIEDLARRRQVGIWVVDAALVEHGLDHDYRTVFHACPRDAGASRRLVSFRALIESVTTLRIVKQPGRPDTQAVADQLEHGALTGRPYDPARLQLRVPTGMEGRDAAPSSPDTNVPKWRIVLPLMSGLVLALSCGFSLAEFNGVYLTPPLILALTLPWPVGRALLGSRERRPVRTQLTWGAWLSRQ